MVDVRFELTTDPWSVDDGICEGISLLSYWQKVNQSPTQTKPYNTLPPFEQRDSWWSYVPTPKFFTISGDPPWGRAVYQILDIRKFTIL